MRSTTKATVTGLALLAILGLAGCAGGQAATQPTSTTTMTQAPPASPTPSVTASAPASAPASTGTGGTGTTSMCSTSNLTGTLAKSAQGGSAGHTYVNLVLTNHGAACTLQGWPGTSLVGTSGNQLGAAATFVTSSPHGTVTLSNGGTATATVSIAQAGNYGDSCTQTPAKGFRVYPPGQKAALFVDGSGYGLTACTQSTIKLLTVTALQ